MYSTCPPFCVHSIGLIFINYMNYKKLLKIISIMTPSNLSNVYTFIVGFFLNVNLFISLLIKLAYSIEITNTPCLQFYNSNETIKRFGNSNKSILCAILHFCTSQFCLTKCNYETYILKFLTMIHFCN